MVEMLNEQVKNVSLELKRQGRALSLETSPREHQGSPEGKGDLQEELTE